MPMWIIACPPDAYADAEKQAFADRITDLYAGVGLPRFYVTVLFQELPKESFFIGGQPSSDFIRIWIDQIARSLGRQQNPTSGCQDTGIHAKSDA